MPAEAAPLQRSGTSRWGTVKAQIDEAQQEQLTAGIKQLKDAVKQADGSFTATGESSNWKGVARASRRASIVQRFEGPAKTTNPTSALEANGFTFTSEPPSILSQIQQPAAHGSSPSGWLTRLRRWIWPPSPTGADTREHEIAARQTGPGLLHEKPWYLIDPVSARRGWRAACASLRLSVVGSDGSHRIGPDCAGASAWVASALRVVGSDGRQARSLWIQMSAFVIACDRLVIASDGCQARSFWIKVVDFISCVALIYTAIVTVRREPSTASAPSPCLPAARRAARRPLCLASGGLLRTASCHAGAPWRVPLVDRPAASTAP